MGTVPSHQKLGAPANPRVVNRDQRAKSEKKNLMLDTPVLVDIEHGTVRYRYRPSDDEPAVKQKRKEKPHDGTKVTEDNLGKDQYFYQPKLSQYGPESSAGKEAPFKFYYVSKGPTRAHDQRLYYVYGIGMSANDGHRTNPVSDVILAHAAEQSQEAFQYNLTFIEDDINKPLEDLEQENLLSTPDKSTIRLLLTELDTTVSVKQKLSAKILRQADAMQLFFDGQVLRDEDVITDLQNRGSDQATECDRLLIQLSLRTS